MLSRTSLLEKIVDLSSEGLMVVNREGVIIKVNKSFQIIHNVPENEAVGRHVTEVIENTRMHVVASTGVPELNRVQRIKGVDYLVSRIPIIEHDTCVGVIGKLIFIDLRRLPELIENINKRSMVYRESLMHAREHVGSCKYTFDDIVTNSPAGKAVKKLAMRAASSDANVLVTGESGVGKELYSHSIHHLSNRRNGPFICINCSAIQDNLFESELFGYEEGAFTGARKKGKRGKFELANNGTIFLDEVGEIPVNVQAKLLRVLQERELDKVGGERLMKINVRVISATNKDLSTLINEGKFRKDLFYRLNVIPVYIPPLRERHEDIPAIIAKRWEKLQQDRGIYHKWLGESALKVMQEFPWPGNERELVNILERVMTIVIQEEITGEHIQMCLMGGNSPPKFFPTPNHTNLNDLLQSTEKFAISSALARTNNNKSKAAEVLGITRSLLYKRMHFYELL